LVRLLLHPAGKFVAVSLIVALIAGIGAFTYYYAKYSRLIEQKLSAGPFPTTSMLFAAPKIVSVGDETAAPDIVALLRRSGYSESRTNRMGWYRLTSDGIEIYPGPDSYFRQEPGVIRFQSGTIARIISLADNTERTRYQLEPELITNLFDRKREKRRIVEFSDIPRVLINAVISIEDKRFFQHPGFDPFRVIKSAYVDLKKGYLAEGASTLTMQVARTFWLNPDKNWSRKLAETLIALQLEQKLTKEQIFEYYANQVDLGRRGSFSIRGFGEAAQAYFGKDIQQLSLSEAATLAGLVQRPSYTNPYRWPERARTRRNVVLSLMRENGYISDVEYATAAASPLVIKKGGVGTGDAAYFVDLVNDELQDDFEGHDFQENSYRVYTTLDVDLQEAAAEAVRAGMQDIDAQLQSRRKRNPNYPQAQVALVALDTQTGEIKALIGGRNYGMSQLNRALAKRQPGSVFKPFVYTAALSMVFDDASRAVTPATTLLDEPTTFWYNGQAYEPSNYKHQFYGLVTVRQALAKSLNIPTVKLAEMAGYDRIVEVARNAGMNLAIQPTPAVALGAYEVTPIEIAGAYTIFANQGTYVKPSWIKYIRDSSGRAIYDYKPKREQAIDPRVAYVMEQMLEEVLRTGTGAGVRARGFSLPAAGKTGTSHDGWFAGFTSKLICAVWVGFDDNRELNLEGARSALPIWTEFMKRAHQLREYRNARPFPAPEGVIQVEIDPTTGQLATPQCPTVRTDFFIAGTQPVEVCQYHGGTSQIAGWETPPPASPTPVPLPRVAPANSSIVRTSRGAPPEITTKADAPAEEREQPKKRGFFGRIRDIFR